MPEMSPLPFSLVWILLCLFYSFTDILVGFQEGEEINVFGQFSLQLKI